MERPPLIDMEFLEAYSFRGLLNYLKQITKTGNFFFKKDGITFRETNSTGVVLVSFKINPQELSIYQYKVVDSEGKEVEELKVGMNLNEMAKKCKGIQKKDGLGIKIYGGGDNKIHLFFNRAKVESTSHSPKAFVDIEETNYINYTEPKYSLTNPSFKPSIAAFTKMCSTIGNCNRGSYSTFECFEKGIIINGRSPNGSLSSQEKLGEPEGDKIHGGRGIVIKTPNPIWFSLEVACEILKSMSKFNNLTFSPIIKFYIEKNLPLKLEISVGTYGNLVIFLRDEKTRVDVDSELVSN